MAGFTGKLGARGDAFRTERSGWSDLDSFGANLIGASPAFLAVRERIIRVAGTSATVLIEGETGTGKELAARAIHYFGERREYPFVAVNCGALPENLVENEFFGHARGAY